MSAPPTLTAPALDLDLIRKYSVPGPRYTSYPPATQFTDQTDGLGLEEAIAADNRDPKGPISLYFHLPFCETRCWFCGCTTVITQRRGAAAEYLDDLIREVKLTVARMDARRPVVQVHFGGGTPTFFPPDELRRLGALIHDHFNLTPDCEFSVEVDPRRLDEDHVKALQEIGANRASLGVQDTNPDVQVAIHRVQPHELNQRVFGWMRAAGFNSINVDLIFGLPLQTPGTFAHTIDDVLGLEPDRLSVFSYAHVPWIKPAQKIFEQRGNLPDAETKLAMFVLAQNRLNQAGYLDIGLDHFARSNDELAVAQREGTLYRNFQGYSTRAGASIYAFGMSSISQTSDSFRQNHKSLPSWKADLDASRLPTERGYRLTEEDQRRRMLIMRIMCDRKLDYAKLSRALNIDVAARYAKEIAALDDLVADGLLVRTTDGITVTPVGVPLLRIIAMRFDAYLKAGAQRHSKTI